MTEIVWLFPKLVAVVFAVAGGVILFAAPTGLSGLLADWGYGRNFTRVFGICAIAAATFLSIPQLRLWGVAIAGFVLFGMTLTLMERRKYLYALPGILLLGMLPFSLANS